MALVVKSAAGDWARKKGLRVSGELWDALDKKLAWMLEEAGKRCKANGRQTIRPEDL